MDVGSLEKGIDDSFKENSSKDPFAKEINPNLPNEGQFAREGNPNLPNEDQFKKELNPNLPNEDQVDKERNPNLPNQDQLMQETNPNLPNPNNIPNMSDFMSDALLFQNDDNFPSNFTQNPLKEGAEEAFLGDSTVSNAFDELYSSHGALEACYEEMRNELMGDFDMDFVGTTHGSVNNNDNVMCGNMEQEVDLLGETEIGTGTGTDAQNDIPSQEKTLNNNNNNNNSCFQDGINIKDKPKDDNILCGNIYTDQEMDLLGETKLSHETLNDMPLTEKSMDVDNEEKKSPLIGDSRNDSEDVDIIDKQDNNIYKDQEANLLDAPKIGNETLNDMPSIEKTLTNEESRKNEETINNSPLNKNNNNNEEEEEEIDIMDSNKNGSPTKEKPKQSPSNTNNEEEEELVDIMDSNENERSPSVDDRYEDTLELQIPQSVQAFNAAPSQNEPTSSVEKSFDRRRRGRKRSRSRSRTRSRSKSRSRTKRRTRSRERERERGREKERERRDRRVSRSPDRRRRRVRSRSPISLRELRRGGGGSPRRRSPIRRRRRSPPPLRRRRSPSPVRRRRTPPIRRSTGFGRPGKNLYVTGFGFDTTVDELESKFSKFGTVSGARIVRDRSGESKGFGFLSMDTDLEADEAIRALDGKIWNNKVLVVEKTKSSQRN